MKHDELVKALLHCSKSGVVECNGCEYDGKEWPVGCMEAMMQDAAAAIEELRAESKKWESCTYNEQKEAFKYLRRCRELEAAQPHWVSVEEPPKGNGAFAACCVYDGKIYWFKAIYLDGKWLREMDGVELPVNYWMEIPQPPQEVQG